MTTAIVTGGAGFIGSHVVERFIAEDIHTIVIDDLSTGRRGNINPLAEFGHGDVRDEQLVGIFERVRPSYLVHLASQIDVRKSEQDPWHDADVNIQGAITMAYLASKYDVPRFLFASSGGTVYGKASVIPTPETEPLAPLCPYGVSKICAEQYIEFFSRTEGLPATTLRFANVYGPRQSTKTEAGVVAWTVETLLRGDQMTLYGDGDQTRDFVYVDDAVDAIMLALQDDFAGHRIYNIGSGKETCINEVYRQVAACTGSQDAPIYDPRGAVGLPRVALDSGKAAREFGWRPKISFEDGIYRTVEAFR